MGDVNDEIRNVNAALAGSGLTMDEINNGFGFGITLGGDFNNPVTIGLGYDRLFGGSEVGDQSGSIKFDLPANAFRAFGEYRLPSSGQFRPWVGIAEGLVSASGSIELAVTGVGTDAGDVSGVGPLTEAYVGGDVWAAPTFAMAASLGYRYAKIGEVKVRDQTVFNADGSKYTLDYSGLLLRVGFKIAFMQ
jgi:hypothetical protein